MNSLFSRFCCFYALPLYFFKLFWKLSNFQKSWENNMMNTPIHSTLRFMIVNILWYMLYLYKSKSCSFFLCYLKIFAYVLNTSACAPKHKVIIHNTLNIGWKFIIDIIISPMTQFSLYLDSSDFPQNIIDFFLIQYFNKDPKWRLIVTP